MALGRLLGRNRAVMNAACIAALLSALSCAVALASPGSALDSLARRAREAAAVGGTVVRGADGWLFFAPELRGLSVGEFWGPHAAAVSRAVDPEYADPAPAILDFHTQLDAAGIELIFVPVPAKAAIYAEAIAPDWVNVTAQVGSLYQRIDGRQARFYDLLREQGVRVIDLAPAFLAHRTESQDLLYCRQDTHWSGAGARVAAAEIAKIVRAQAWVADVTTYGFGVERVDAAITGDLWAQLGDDTLLRETVRLHTVTAEPGAPAAWASNEWRESPVLLLGDSHCLVFHAGGDMHARGAGLADHLAKELGFPPDVVGVRGSGATPSRLALLRRRDNLAGKRVVIWCLSVREFTESQGWRKVPVIR